jgi:endonuclease/exonuclease/phosphatase family metal-dependent hydrolase
MAQSFEFTCLTFNIFIGKHAVAGKPDSQPHSLVPPPSHSSESCTPFSPPHPLPTYPGTATPQLTGHYTPCLHGCRRLDKIIAALRACGSDILCLQEVHSESVLEELRASLGDKYAFVTAHKANIRSRLALEAIHVVCGFVALLAALASLALFGGSAPSASSADVEPALAFGILDVVVAVLASAKLELVLGGAFSAGFYGSRQWFRQSALSNFLRCSTHGGVVTLYDRTKFRLRSSEFREFSEQRGDLLNTYKPRCAAAARLEPLLVAPATIQRGSTSSSGGLQHELLVINVHMNLGSDALRHSQMREVVDMARSAQESADAGGVPTSAIIAGDFNAYDGMPTVSGLSRLGFTDCFVESGIGRRETWLASNPLTHGSCREPDGRVDYVFFRPAVPGLLRSTLTRTVFNAPPYISDHFGVLTTLTAASSGCSGEHATPAEAVKMDEQKIEQNDGGDSPAGAGISSSSSTDTIEDDDAYSCDEIASRRSGSESGLSLVDEL